MILPSDIIKHIATVLPLYTDVFSVFVDVDYAEAIDSSTVRVHTNIPHGLIVGNSIIAKDGLLENKIISAELISNDMEILFETEYQHDLVMTYDDSFDKTIELDGFTETYYNTTHILRDVPSRTKIVIDHPDGGGLPILTGSEKLYEDRPYGINGNAVISNIVSANIFEYQVFGKQTLPVNNIARLKVVESAWIGVVSGFERAKTVYTKLDAKACLYLIMTDLDASKDPRTLGLSTANFTQQDAAILELVQSFSTVIFLDTTDSLTGFSAQELIYGEIFNALMKTLYCYQQDNKGYRMIFNGHGQTVYNSAFYAQSYDWQYPYLTDQYQGVDNFRNVAFRNINYDLDMLDNAGEPLALRINLDKG